MASRNKYQAFISYAHLDSVFTDKLVALLSKSGFSIWYDKTCLPTNAPINRDLSNYIVQCNSLILVISQNSCASDWVNDEYSFAKNSKINIIPIKIDNCEMPGFLSNYKWIDCIGGLNYEIFYQIVEAIYNVTELSVSNDMDTYLSCPWRESEINIRTKFASILKKKGIKLIGDSEEQLSYNNGDRVLQIMNSCRGFVAIVPYRNRNNTSNYIIDEIEKAYNLGLPGLLISDRRVQGLERFVNYDTYWFNDGEDDLIELNDMIEDLLEKFVPPHDPQYVFYATELSVERKHFNKIIGKLINLVARIPSVFGENISGDNLQQQLVQRISNAFIVISDISEQRFNTCIEAGIARGAKRTLYLVAKGKRTTPPFMFRDMEVAYYDDECDLLAIIHKILFPHKRRVLNEEL